jgi:hypothetical protein
MPFGVHDSLDHTTLSWVLHRNATKAAAKAARRGNTSVVLCLDLRVLFDADRDRLSFLGNNSQLALLLELESSTT